MVIPKLRRNDVRIGKSPEVLVTGKSSSNSNIISKGSVKTGAGSVRNRCFL